MERLRVLSLFSGIGAFEKALTNLNVSFDLVGFSEIDDRAVKSYCAIHNIDKSMNLGDITQIDTSQLDNIDIITHGSPCQDFSVSGLAKLGGDEGSGTRSSLMWNTVKIVQDTLPKVVIWENVKGVLQKNNIHNYEKYVDTLAQLGYTHYTQIVNSKYFGVAQDRDRLFVVSVLTDIHDTFEFPTGNPTPPTLKEQLDDIVDESYYIHNIRNCRRTKKYIQFDPKGSGHNSQQYRLYYLDGQMCTLPNRNSGDKAQVLLSTEPYIGRKITECEAWRLMGFTTEDFNKAKATGQTKGSLYGQAGNSIVVPVAEAIFNQLFKYVTFN